MAVRVAVLGTGYVGLTTACCLAELGHEVVGYDVDPDRLASIEGGQVPFHEPSLDVLLARHRGVNLRCTSSLAEAASADLVFICVGTPPGRDGAPDLTALSILVQDLGQALGDPKTIITKSTVPVGTNRWIASQLMQTHPEIQVVSNPEFLREGSAVVDFFQPDRIIIGGDMPAVGQVAHLYQSIDAPLLITSWEAAELAKYATNAYLATRVAFVNELARLCAAVGVDVDDVAMGAGLDRRIGTHYLQPGPGYGGSCLPKDVAALLWQARRLGVEMDLLEAAQRSNRRQRRWLVSQVRKELGELEGKSIAVWGLSFKAGTGDLRGAAALTVIPALCRQGAEVKAHDPMAGSEAAERYARQGIRRVKICDDPWAAAAGADALLILTEWPEYQVEVERLIPHMRGRLIIDARNLLDPAAAARAGFHYVGVGRRS